MKWESASLIDQIEGHVNMIVSDLPIFIQKFKIFVDETINNSELSLLKNILLITGLNLRIYLML